jgi:Domain of unknown function (DUF5666)
MGLGLVLLFASVSAFARVPQEGAAAAGQAPDEGRRMPLFGKITAVHDSSMEVVNVNGDTVTVKLTDKTEFRKDRQPVKRSDFKVGDLVAVRGEENPDHTWAAQVVSARSANGNGGPNGRGGPGPGGRGGFGGETGTLGKDYVVGEIKSIDAPRLSVLRSDNVTQTLELNEDTSLRKGRDSVTMADIQVGDHLFARGAVQNDVFVPKSVMVIGPDQWKRMQEMGGQPGGQRRPRDASSGTGAGAAPGADSPTQKPPESQP